ncbi:MAG: hypothetical protein ACFFCO_11075, partial [Promethearchaeota archaeon]
MRVNLISSNTLCHAILIAQGDKYHLRNFRWQIKGVLAGSNLPKRRRDQRFL